MPGIDPKINWRRSLITKINQLFLRLDEFLQFLLVSLKGKDG